MKKIAALLLVFALLASAGCSKKDDGDKITLTAGEVRDRMVAAIDGITELRCVVNCSFTVGFSAESDGMSFDINLSSTLNGEEIIAGDPASSYSKTTTVSNVLDMTEEEVKTVYVLPEDGKYMTYTHNSVNDKWVVEADNGEKQEEMDDSTDLSFFHDIDEKDLILEQETETINDLYTYVLHTTVTGDQMVQLGMDLGDVNVDLSNLEIPMTVWIDTETFRPVRMTMKLGNLSTLLLDIVPDFFGNDMEGVNYDMSIEDFVADFSYDDIEIPPLPDEARENAEPAPYDPKQSDGSYIIYDKGVAARIVFAEGWECTAAQPVFVCGFDEGHEHFVAFTVHPAMSRDELVEKLMNNYQCDPEKCTFLSPIGDYEVLMWSDGKYDAQYFAFTQIGEGWLEVYTFTMEAEDMIPILTEVLPMAAEYSELPTADFS